MSRRGSEYNKPKIWTKNSKNSEFVVAGVKLPKNAGEKFPLLGI